MLATRKSKVMDSQIKFSSTENSGVLIQHQHNRALFFVEGIVKDELFFDSETKASELDGWVAKKRELYNEQKKKGALQCASEE
jgi:hypothetical protein